MLLHIKIVLLEIFSLLKEQKKDIQKSLIPFKTYYFAFEL